MGERYTKKELGTSSSYDPPSAGVAAHNSHSETMKSTPASGPGTSPAAVPNDIITTSFNQLKINDDGEEAVLMAPTQNSVSRMISQGKHFVFSS